MYTIMYTISVVVICALCPGGEPKTSAVRPTPVAGAPARLYAIFLSLFVIPTCVRSFAGMTNNDKIFGACRQPVRHEPGASAARLDPVEAPRADDDATACESKRVQHAATACVVPDDCPGTGPVVGVARARARVWEICARVGASVRAAGCLSPPPPSLSLPAPPFQVVSHSPIASLRPSPLPSLRVSACLPPISHPFKMCCRIPQRRYDSIP